MFCVFQVNTLRHVISQSGGYNTEGTAISSSTSGMYDPHMQQV